VSHGVGCRLYISNYIGFFILFEYQDCLATLVSLYFLPLEYHLLHYLVIISHILLIAKALVLLVEIDLQNYNFFSPYKIT